MCRSRKRARTVSGSSSDRSSSRGGCARRDPRRWSAGGGSLMGGAWMYCTFDLRGHPVTVAVRRLEADERVRLAAEIAWYAAGLIGCEPFPPAGWPDLLDRIFTNDVAVSCSEVLWEARVKFRTRLSAASSRPLLLPISSVRDSCSISCGVRLSHRDECQPAVAFRRRRASNRPALEGRMGNA